MYELLSKQNIDYMERAREVAEKYVRPRAAELDQTREYGWDILEALKSYELTGAWIPKEYGGHDAGVLTFASSLNSCHAHAVASGCFAVNALGSFPIILGGTEEQKQKYLPPLPRVRADRLRAVRKSLGIRCRQPADHRHSDGDEYVLNGHKKWNTNGGVASCSPFRPHRT